MDDGKKRKGGAASQASLKRNFRESRTGEIRPARDRNDDVDDDDDDEEEVKAPVTKPGKKSREEIEAEHLSEDSGDEEAGERGKVKQRERTRLNIAALKKQGINLDSDGEDEDDDQDDEGEFFREHLATTGRKAGDEADTSNPFVSGKVQTDYEAPSREKLEELFGKGDDDLLEEFTMGPRSTKYLYGRAGQVLEEEEGTTDAWLSAWGDGTPKSEIQVGERDGLGLFGRRKKKQETKDASMIRRSKDPMANLEIILSHVQPGENILKALKRLGSGSKPVQNTYKKNVRTKKSDAQSLSDTPAAPASSGGDPRAFEELTEAAQNLLDAGEIEIYSESYESIALVLQRIREKKQKEDAERKAQLAAEAANKPAQEIHWQYQWSASDTRIHGPFIGSEMEEWKGDGYFNEHVLVQRVGPGHPPGESLEWVLASSIQSFILT